MTRRASNLYEVDFQNRFIETAFCFEFVFFQNATLTMNGRTGTLTFANNGASCPVRGVYAPLSMAAGNYATVADYRSDDWYALTDSGGFDSLRLRTQTCFQYRYVTSSVLSWNFTQSGNLIFTGSVGAPSCQAIGLYAPISLP